MLDAISNTTTQFFLMNTAVATYVYNGRLVLFNAILTLCMCLIIYWLIVVFRFFANLFLRLCGKDQAYNLRKHNKQFLKSIDVQQDTFTVLPEGTSVLKQAPRKMAKRLRNTIYFLLFLWFSGAQSVALAAVLGNNLSCPVWCILVLCVVLMLILLILEIAAVLAIMVFGNAFLSDAGWFYRAVCRVHHSRKFKRLRVRKKKVGRKS